MNYVDLILVVLVVLSLVRGVRLGAVMQVLSFGGFWLGLLLGAVLAPKVANLFSGSFSRSVAAIVVLFGMAALVGGLGRQLGVRAWEMIRRVHLGPADSAIGAVVAVVATLLAAWIVAGMLSTTSLRRVSSAVDGSAIIRRIDDLLPPAPGVFSRIQQLLKTNGLPQVFAGLTPQGALPPVKPAGPPVVRAAEANAGNSTVKIVSHGCGEILEGSGFVVAPDTIVTNAHVIAGTTSIDVQDTGGVQSATPIWFDPNFDLAVLRTPRPLAGRPLTVDASDVQRGTPAVVLGFPEGGDFNAQPAGIDQQFEAQGRNIYGTGLTLRSVYEIHALVRPGNSGGPLVLADGTVIGVVFSTSATQNDIGYALASPQVRKEVQSAERANTPTGTGSCAE